LERRLWKFDGDTDDTANGDDVVLEDNVSSLCARITLVENRRFVRLEGCGGAAVRNVGFLTARPDLVVVVIVLVVPVDRSLSIGGVTIASSSSIYGKR